MKIVNMQNERYLVRLTNLNRLKSSSWLNVHLRAETGIQVGNSTLRRRLNKNGLW